VSLTCLREKHIAGSDEAAAFGRVEFKFAAR
jgi:hypothetical protein